MHPFFLSLHISLSSTPNTWHHYHWLVPQRRFQIRPISSFDPLLASVTAATWRYIHSTQWPEWRGCERCQWICCCFSVNSPYALCAVNEITPTVYANKAFVISAKLVLRWLKGLHYKGIETSILLALCLQSLRSNVWSVILTRHLQPVITTWKPIMFSSGHSTYIIVLLTQAANLKSCASLVTSGIMAASPRLAACCCQGGMQLQKINESSSSIDEESFLFNLVVTIG